MSFFDADVRNRSIQLPTLHQVCNKFPRSNLRCPPSANSSLPVTIITSREQRGVAYLVNLRPILPASSPPRPVETPKPLTDSWG
jgi:hypothetical protein